MAAMTISKVHEMPSELSKPHTNLLSIQFGYVNSMALRCAMQIGIPDLIHSNDSSSISLSELAAAIPIPETKSPNLYRLMRLLVHLGIFALDESSGTTEPKYILTPASKLLTTNHDNIGVVPYSKMVLDPALVNPLFYLGDWIKMEGSLPFELCHGGNMWVVAAQKPDLNKDFNAAMDSDSQLLMSFIVTHSPQLFHGLKSLIDVGGGTGGCARTIAKAFPDLNVKVLDLPHVAADFPKDDGVQFIVGDMFKHIPSTDAVLLKHILHDWNDEECVQILKNCKKAVASKEEGGKVIIMEVVMNSKLKDPEHTQVEYEADVLMMTLTSGWQREEKEWSKIFKDAGFKEYKITPGFGVRSVIELYH